MVDTRKVQSVWLAHVSENPTWNPNTSCFPEIIRDLHYDPSRKKMAADRLLRDAVHEGRA
jgi:hypothetical protein